MDNQEMLTKGRSSSSLNRKPGTHSASQVAQHSRAPRTEPDLTRRGLREGQGFPPGTEGWQWRRPHPSNSVRGRHCSRAQGPGRSRRHLGHPSWQHDQPAQQNHVEGRERRPGALSLPARPPPSSPSPQAPSVVERAALAQESPARGNYTFKCIPESTLRSMQSLR